MRYQERIYIQSDNHAVRNKDILNVNMSSDFCVFQSPQFGLSGATKVQCDDISINLTGYSFNVMLMSAYTSCITTGNTSCYSATTWQTKIYQNTNLTYSGNFFTTSSLTGVTPSNNLFINSVALGFDTLGINYTNTGSEFTIDKPYGTTNLEIDVCIDFGFRSGGTGCPVGYSASTGLDGCERILITAATFNGTGATINAGDKASDYTAYGTYFYPDLTKSAALPVYYPGSLLALKDQTGGTINALNVSNTLNPFWYNLSVGTTDGRLNNVGLSAVTSEFRGFSKCINILSGGTYYIGIAADNYCKFLVNGLLIAAFSGSAQENFKIWSVFPINLMSGKNIIEMYGENAASISAFGAEVYDPISYAVLTGSTSTGSSQANVIFTTADYIGKTWEIGTTAGYTCPAGYALDSCGTAFTCTQILKTGFTGNCTGSCMPTCVSIVNQAFPHINSSSQGVYILNSGSNTLPLSFNFTANTDMFTSNNASFKYEIYKYNQTLGIFTLPAVFKSDIINYSTFSGTNILTQSISTDDLLLDGQYLVKGYYEADACTDYLRRLGKKIDTSIYKTGQNYQLYNEAMDYYFVATSGAESPQFTQSQVDDLTYFDAQPLYQQVIIIDNSKEFNVTEGSGDQAIVVTGNTYYQDGNIFTLQSPFVGDVVVTQDGRVLTNNVDYTLSGTILTFAVTPLSGDILTFIYTRSSQQSIVVDTISISSPIVSGATNTQGNNTTFYNTTTGMYEVYTQNNPLAFSNAIIILNGVTLVGNIDFYQSTTNQRRFILSGHIMLGDVINIIYYPQANIINGISQNNNSIYWHIQNPPQDSNGEFLLEYDTNVSFSSLTISNVVPYQTNLTNYNSILSLTGSVGTTYYYRVKNIKNFLTLCGDPISSSAYSEVVSVIIQSNVINSY